MSCIWIAACCSTGARRFILTTGRKQQEFLHFLLSNLSSTIKTKKEMINPGFLFGSSGKGRAQQRNIKVKTAANCNSLCQIYTSKYTNLLINFATNAELDFKLRMWFSEKSDANQWEKLLAWHCLLLFVVVVTRRAVQKLLRIPLTRPYHFDRLTATPERGRQFILPKSPFLSAIHPSNNNCDINNPTLETLIQGTGRQAFKLNYKL